MPFLSSHSIRHHMPSRKVSLESLSQGHKSERQDVLPTCSVTVQMMTEYKLWSWKDLGLTLGSIAYCLYVTKQAIYPQPSLGFLDSRRMHNLPTQMVVDLKWENIPKALSVMPGAGSTEGLHNHSHHLLSCDTGQPEKQYHPEKCLQTGHQGGTTTRRWQGLMKKSQEYVSNNFSKPCNEKRVIWNVRSITMRNFCTPIFPELKWRENKLREGRARTLTVFSDAARFLLVPSGKIKREDRKFLSSLPEREGWARIRVCLFSGYEKKYHNPTCSDKSWIILTLNVQSNR